MPNTPTPDLLPLADDALARWWTDIDAALATRKAYEPWWEANLEKYSPKVTRNPKAYGEDINTNRDFSLVEQKKAQLFFQTPAVNIKASPLLYGQEEAVLAHQDILNELLGADGVNVIQMVDEALFDVLCPAGVGVTKMGYESVTERVTTQVPVPDPMTGAPAVDPMTGTPLVMDTEVDVPIWERLFWERITPKKVLIPSNFSSTNYDEAPWLGVQFSLSLNEARLKYTLPEDFEASKGGTDTTKFDHGTEPAKNDRPVEGVELFYRAALYDETVKNPDLLRVLTLIRGLDEPVEHKTSPYQELDPATGKLSANSLAGFPIHILTTRTLADSAYVMSDCSISRPQVNELNKFREQQIRLRDSNVPIRLYNTDVLPPEVKAKIDAAEYGGTPIGVPAEAFAGNPPIIEIAKATYPRENFTFEEKQDADIARTHSLDANQGGTRTDNARTATELQLIQVNSNVRLDKERARVLAWYIKGVTKFSTLAQRFVTLEQATRIIGPQRAQTWAQVMKQVPAALAFEAMPDSAIRVDAAQRRKFAMETYAFFRNDPTINTEMLLKQSVFPALGLSSSVYRPPTPPPPPPPEKPKISLSIKGEDLSPMMPQYPAVLIMLDEAGMDTSKLPPATPVTINPGIVKPDRGMEAGGPANSGGMQGMNVPAPIGPGGQGMSNEVL